MSTTTVDDTLVRDLTERVSGPCSHRASRATTRPAPSTTGSSTAGPRSSSVPDDR